jgi:hypothetical protein
MLQLRLDLADTLSSRGVLLADEPARGYMRGQGREIAEKSGRALNRRVELVAP